MFKESQSRDTITLFLYTPLQLGTGGHTSGHTQEAFSHAWLIQCCGVLRVAICVSLPRRNGHGGLGLNQSVCPGSCFNLR